MVSSTCDITISVPEKEKRKIIQTVYKKEEFTKREIATELNISERLVEQVLNEMSYQGTIMYLTDRFVHASYSYNRYY
jgi:DNA-binding transcriptional regulator LsrR (DeoR family)